jgi:lysophospholipase L1-like esterase
MIGMRRVMVVVTVLLGVSLMPAAGSAATVTPSLPGSMAALGDSITEGFNACGWYVDCTSRSWSTGDASAVNSHYLRLKLRNPALARHDNHAVSGAEMVDLAAQADAVAGQSDVTYVTILIGANDACASSESKMTPVDTFRSQFEAALARLDDRGDIAVFVASIPNIKRLWEVGKGSFSARSAWSLFGICQSMLQNPTSTNRADVDRRDRVLQRVTDYNAVLAEECAQYAGYVCRFDGGAVFGTAFTLSDLSRWDYFHPNQAGQAKLAAVTHATSFWP